MRLVRFDQGTVTLELDADECLSLSQACEVLLRGDGEAIASARRAHAFASRVRAHSTYRSLSRGLLACARVGQRQHHMARGLAAARDLGLSERPQQAIAVVD